MSNQHESELVGAIATRVRERRMHLGLSQEQLAELANVPVEVISRVENSKVQPTLATLQALARGLETRLGELVDPATPTGLTEEEERLIRAWRRLGAEARERFLWLMEGF